MGRHRIELPPLAPRLGRGSCETLPASPPNTQRLSGPPPQVVLALSPGADLHGMARQDPGPPGQALARHRQPQDHVRGITTALCRQARLRGA
jgi:hypothetical protein